MILMHVQHNMHVHNMLAYARQILLFKGVSLLINELKKNYSSYFFYLKI